MSDRMEEQVADITFSVPYKEKAEAFKTKLKELGYSVFDPPKLDPESGIKAIWYVEEPSESDIDFVTINCTFSELEDEEFKAKLEKLAQEFDATFDGCGMGFFPMLSPEQIEELSQKIEDNESEQ